MRRGCGWAGLGPAGQERSLASTMAAVVAADYEAVIADAESSEGRLRWCVKARPWSSPVAARPRMRRRIATPKRDYFPPRRRRTRMSTTGRSRYDARLAASTGRALTRRADPGTMRWVTRARPKTDRIACPWLIRRFIDPDAEILYVPEQDVHAFARDTPASPSPCRCP